MFHFEPTCYYRDSIIKKMVRKGALRGWRSWWTTSRRSMGRLIGASGRLTRFCHLLLFFVFVFVGGFSLKSRFVIFCLLHLINVIIVNFHHHHHNCCQFQCSQVILSNVIMRPDRQLCSLPKRNALWDR